MSDQASAAAAGEFAHPEDPGWVEMPEWIGGEPYDIGVDGDEERAIPIAFLSSRSAPVDRSASLSWPDLAGLLSSADAGQKDGPAWMPADIDPGPRKGERVRSISLLVLDVEAHTEGRDEAKKVIGPEPPQFQQIRSEIAERGWRALLHTSFNHSPEHHRYRLVFDLSRALAPTELRSLGEHIALLLGVHDACDLKCLEPARLFYLPRRRTAGPVPLFAEINGRPLDADLLLTTIASIKAAPSRQRERESDNRSDVIGAFNARWTPAELIERNGYKRVGGRWLFSGSSSGIPGIVQLPDTDPPRMFSHHAGDPLATGHACDAFDCFMLLEHRGDLAAAVRAAAESLGLRGKTWSSRRDHEEIHNPDTGEVFGHGSRGVNLADFYAYMPTHNYIFAPSGEFWPASSVNSRIPPIALMNERGEPILHAKGQKKGEPVELQANAWLDQNRPVEQMTWAPGEGQVVRDRLISEGGWIARSGNAVFNLYRPPMPPTGDARLAQPWIDHVQRVYPDDAQHLIRWLAHRAQHPAEKINHAIVMGGAQGIGKDTILEPVKSAVGPWNFSEVSPQHMLGRFNGFVRSVILRVSEARDLGDVDRFAFYDHMKTYTAAPPDVLRVDEKHLREYSVFNVCGVIITTNHKTDGIFLPADDRRHYVAWSECARENFTADYWTTLYRWYADGGIGHVVAYLRSLTLANFDAKAPPEKTPAFWDIVASNRAPEDAEMADVIDSLGAPEAVTILLIADRAEYLGNTLFKEWLLDRRNSRKIPHRLEECGYAAVRNRHANDGLYKVGGKRCAIYARKALSPRDAIAAAEAMTR